LIASHRFAPSEKTRIADENRRFDRSMIDARLHGGRGVIPDAIIDKYGRVRHSQ